MTKKFLSTVAAAAVLSTGAMAFDVTDDVIAGAMTLPYAYNNAIAASQTAAPTVEATAAIAPATRLQQGDALIFPAYFVGGGWETTIRVVNTSQTNAVVAKVVLYAGNDSRELRDFNIYLSAGDVWTGTIKVDADGVAKVISTDDSSPLPGGGMADANNPMKSDSIDVPSGYIEVIGCAMTVDPTNDFLGAAAAANAAPYTTSDFKNAAAHADHANLRAAYQAMAKNIRGTGANPVFQNGVITSGALVPNVNLATAVTAPTNAGGDNVADYFFTDVANVLTGDVRITDTVNGKDMVMPAIELTNVTSDADAQALLYIEGEAANIADRVLTGADAAAGATANNNNAASSEYDYGALAIDAIAFLANGVAMTYGDSSSLANNQTILTSPYKRLLVLGDANAINAGATPVNVTSNGNYGVAGSNIVGGTAGLTGGYLNVQSANGAISDWGYFSGLTRIFDESENMAAASQFSPANTPTLNFHYEVSATEGNGVQTDNLSYYLQQAQANGGFERGYALMGFILNGAATPEPVIATQMIATDVAGRVITNWITPELF